MSIVTVTEAEQFLGVASGTDTTIITSFIDYSQALIENYTDANFDSEAVTGEVLNFGGSNYDLSPQELIDLRGYDLVAFTRYSPISEITLYNGDTELTVDTEYKFNTKNGAIYLYTAVSDYAQNFTIDYTYGYETYPSDLKFVMLDMIAKMYANHGTTKSEGDISSKKLGSFSVSYSSQKVTTDDYNVVLDKYKVINI